MAARPDSPDSDELLNDPLLRDAPIVEGFKVLEPAVLYAKIGAGGMGAVYRGRHYKLDLDVAVKCLNPSLAAEDADFVKRFEREARLAASIGHQNVVRVMDVHEKNGLHYLVMEFVRGETAAERVRRKGKLAEKEALAILLGACAGLAEAHQRGIVHRDIKPENLMISLEGRVKLADLGLAKSSGGVDGRSVSMPASRIMGTPQYMPPEQWDTTDVTPAADVWALGATFYFLVTGQAAISGAGTYHAVAKRIQERDYPTLRVSRPDLRPEVHALFERCVRRDPKERFADARVLLRVLRRLVSEDEDVLLDPETGTSIARAGTVTPPPKATILRIRALVDTQATPQHVEPEPAGGFERPSEGQAKPSPDLMAPRPRGAAAKSSGAPLLAVAALVALGTVGAGYAAGWFAPSATGDKKAEADAAFEAGQQAVRQADQLDVGIAKLERVLELDGTRVEAKRLLAGALSAKAEDLAATKLDEAFGACRRAVELEPGNSVLVRRHEALRAKLVARLQGGLALREPQTEVLSSRQLSLSGVAASPNLKALRLAILTGDKVPAEFPANSKPVQWIADKFTNDEVVATDGVWLLWLEGEDGNGLRATAAPVRVVVDTADPVVTIEQPMVEATVGRNVPVRVSVWDTTACTVEVNGREVTRGGDGAFTASLTLEDGPQVVQVEARDAVGRSRAAKCAIVVDGKPPVLSLAVLPKMTKDARVSISGTVRDLRGGELKVDGKVVTPGADGAFAVVFPLAADQKYDVEVVAVDRLGNRAREQVAVRRDTTPPVVEWASPDPSQPVRAGEVEVSGTVRDDSQVTLVTVNDKPASLNGTTWRTTVQVAAGQPGARLPPPTRLTVVATDEVGNASKPMMRSVIVLTEEAAAEAMKQAAKNSPAAYGARFDERSKLIDGTRHKSVAAGLEWLRKHQDEDGRWDCDQFMKHDKEGEVCTGEGNAFHDVGVSGLALLAFLGDGNTLKLGTYSAQVRKGIDWLIKQQDENGQIGKNDSSACVYSHAIATMALCEACGLSQDASYKGKAQRPINYILNARNPYGAWRYQPRDNDNDTSITCWMVQALLSAKAFNLAVDDAALQAAIVWFDKVTDATGASGYGKVGDGSARPVGKQVKFPQSKTEALTAAVLLCRYLMKQDPKACKTMRPAADTITSKLPVWDPDDGSIDMYYWYYASHAMYQVGGSQWDAWSKKMTDVAVKTQRTEGNPNGSWDSIDAWGEEGGRVYSTAIMLLCLEAPYRYARVR